MAFGVAGPRLRGATRSGHGVAYLHLILRRQAAVMTLLLITVGPDPKVDRGSFKGTMAPPSNAESLHNDHDGGEGAGALLAGAEDI
jgi:hypothetical protein